MTSQCVTASFVISSLGMAAISSSILSTEMPSDPSILKGGASAKHPFVRHADAPPVAYHDYFRPIGSSASTEQRSPGSAAIPGGPLSSSSPAALTASHREWSPPVKIETRDDFRRYAVAYGLRHAVVAERSLIPTAVNPTRPSPGIQLARTSPRIPLASPATATARRPAMRPIKLRVRTTAYTHNEWDHLKYGRKTARGDTLKYGKTLRSAAADWSRFPVGTEFRIVGQPGVTYLIDDYGGALVGTNTIDLYKPTFASMNQWGARYVDIEITKWGSFSRSLEIMRDRLAWPHVRRMVAAIDRIHRQRSAQVAALMLN